MKKKMFPPLFLGLLAACAIPALLWHHISPIDVQSAGREGVEPSPAELLRLYTWQEAADGVWVKSHPSPSGDVRLTQNPPEAPEWQVASLPCPGMHQRMVVSRPPSGEITIRPCVGPPKVKPDAAWTWSRLMDEWFENAPR